MIMVRAALLRRATLAASIVGSSRLLCTAFTPAPAALTQLSSRGQNFFPNTAFHLGGPRVHSPRLSDRLYSSSVDRSDRADAESGISVSYDDDLHDGMTNMYTYDSDDGGEDIDEDDEAEYDNEDDSNELGAASMDPNFLMYKALIGLVQSCLTNISKKTTSLQRELEKAQSLEETQKRANLIVSNLYRLPPGTTSAQVEDWENDGQIVELVLNTKEYGSAQEESDALFALARKMKRGSKVVEGLMEESLEAEGILKDSLVDLLSMIGKTEADLSIDISDFVMDDMQLDQGTLVLIQERLERSSKKTGFQSPDMNEIMNTNNSSRQQQNQKSRTKSSQKSRDKLRNKPNPRELVSPSGHKVLVGRNRRDNEAICFQLSRPTDIWMHARGCPGAHVLLCIRRGSPEVRDEDLQFAADLAIFYSDARTERRAEVTTAEPKHITKPRGAPPGAVTLRQEGKTLVGRPENVSEDLKEAREQSGGAWDEMGYRKLGTRAKNKKRTASVEKERKQKKREEAREKNKRRKKKQEDFRMSGFD